MSSGNGERWDPLRPQLSPVFLEKSLDVLRKNFSFISLQAAVEILGGGRAPVANAIVMTFDDGYRSNLTHALPILRKYGIPATFFLSTGQIERRIPFWVDRLDFAIQQADLDGRDVQIGGEKIRIRGRNQSDLRKSYSRIRNAAKRMSGDYMEMDNALNSLAETLETESGRSLNDFFEDDPWSGLMTAEEIKSATGNDITFGSHTVDHFRMNMSDSKFMRKQFEDSKKSIEKWTGEECRFLCYPYGIYNREGMEIARKCGYTAALTSTPGRNKIGADLYSLRRTAFPMNEEMYKILPTANGLASTLGRIKSSLKISAE